MGDKICGWEMKLIPDVSSIPTMLEKQQRNNINKETNNKEAYKQERNIYMELSYIWKFLTCKHHTKDGKIFGKCGT